MNKILVKQCAHCKNYEDELNKKGLCITCEEKEIYTHDKSEIYYLEYLNEQKELEQEMLYGQQLLKDNKIVVYSHMDDLNDWEDEGDCFEGDYYDSSMHNKY